MPFHNSTRLMYEMSLKLNGLIKWAYEILPLQFDLYQAYLPRTCEVYIIIKRKCIACRTISWSRSFNTMTAREFISVKNKTCLFSIIYQTLRQIQHFQIKDWSIWDSFSIICMILIYACGKMSVRCTKTCSGSGRT